MGLAAVGEHKLAGIVPVGAILKASLKVGRLWAPESLPAQNVLRVLP
jgi:hypothetical protein